MSEVTAEGARLIRAWTEACDRVAGLRRQMTDAQNSVTHTAKELAAWLKPHDAKPGEKFAVWFGDNLIQVEVGGVVHPGTDGQAGTQTTDKITIRTRGKSGL